MITTEHPLRHSFQAMVSLGQIYGDILYYATSMFDHYYTGRIFWRPEAYYFWGYYFFMNFIWIVIPGCEYCKKTSGEFCWKAADWIQVLLYQSFEASQRAFKALAKETKSKQGKGGSKKAN